MAAKSFRPPSEKENEEAQEDPKPQAGGIKKKRKDMEASDPLPITNEASSSLGRSILLLPVTVPTILQKEKQPRKRRRTAESSEEKEQTKQLEEEKEDCVDIAKRFKCAVPGCGMSFIKQFKLERHMRTHDKKRPFHCLWPGCAMSFSRKDHLKRHQLIHTDARDYKCTHPGCAHAFNTNRKLRRHLKMHENPLPYVCTHTQCQAKFAKKNQLRSHECEAHDGGLPFRCSSDGCSMKFRTQSELRRHRNIEHGAKRYFCDGAGCGEAFVRFLEFQAHRRHFHPELFTYPCKDCGEIFTSKTQLGKHAVSHKKGYRCESPGCAKAFSTKYNLTTHINMVHLKIRSFKCTVLGCEKAFSTKGSLKRHVDKIHSQEEARKQQLKYQERQRARLLKQICGL